MDLSDIEELHCAICFALFGEGIRCPRILTCGHSFCHSCLENLLVESPTCPNCKQGTQFSNAGCIPVNYIAKSLVSRYETYKPCRTILLAEALNETKQKISIEVEAEIETQNSQNKNLDKLLQYLKEKRMSLKNNIKELQFDLRSKIESLKSLSKCIEKLQSAKSDRKKNCEMLKHLETSLKETPYNDQFMKAEIKLNIFLTRAQTLVKELTIPGHFYCHLSKQLLRDWCQEGSVYAVRSHNGSSQFGKVVVKGDRVWVHCFQSQGPSRKDVIISFRELLIAFSGSSEFPRRGFIQVSDLNDIVIATDALTPRAMNFLLLCSGIKGRSYEGVRLMSYERRWIGPHLNEGGKAVVKGIKDGGVYDAPWKKGFVEGNYAQDKNCLSGFGILMECQTSKSITKFGFAEEGIDVFEGILSNKNKAFRIKHCGLVT